MRRLVSNQRGMTLAEVLVALPIITIGLLALLSAIPLSTYAIQDGSQTSTATFLANQRLEQVRSAQWTALCPAAAAVDQLGVSASSTAAPPNFADESPLAAPYAAYSRQVRIQNAVVSNIICAGSIMDPASTYGSRRITVTITYTPLSATGTNAVTGSRSVVVNMLVAQR